MTAKQLEDLFGVFILVFGIISVCGAYFDWDWYINLQRVPFFLRGLERNGRRVLYAFGGIVLIIIGILDLTGVINWTDWR